MNKKTIVLARVVVAIVVLTVNEGVCSPPRIIETADTFMQ
jgi:hypothetical protein